MNFIFVSPQFPHVYWNFCDRLKKKGVNVLGIGDTPYDQLTREMREALTEYYFVPALDDYDQMLRAVGFFTFKYGRIDWLESNNEHWLMNDARLRTDFNIRTGWQSADMEHIKSKSAMKAYYQKAGIPTARLVRASDRMSVQVRQALTASTRMTSCGISSHQSPTSPMSSRNLSQAISAPTTPSSMQMRTRSLSP